MISDYLSNIKALILDMDGVLWCDTQPLGKLSAIFDQIRDFGYQFVFVTNNATRTVDEYLDKLAGFGVQVEREQIFTAAEATGWYLSEQYPVNASVYVVGQPSLKHTITAHGLNVVDDTKEDARVVVASILLEPILIEPYPRLRVLFPDQALLLKHWKLRLVRKPKSLANLTPCFIKWH